MIKIVIDDKIPYIRPGLEALGRELARNGQRLMVEMRAGDRIDRNIVADADVLIVRTRTRCDEALLGGSSVRLVVTATIGYDHLDTAWLERAGIAWTNCPGCNATSVAQYVGSCLLLLERERGMQIGAMTVGVIGVGHVGTAVVARLREMGIGRIMLCDPPREERGEEADFPTGEPSGAIMAGEEGKEGEGKGGEGRRKKGGWSSLVEVMGECDVVTVHTPLTREGRHATWHLLDGEVLGRLKRGGVIINAARGGVVDEEALEAAMDAGIVSEAIIDTWEGEPNVRRSLLERAFIATPHIAGYSADGKANATRMALEAVARYIGLEMIFDVQPPRLTEQLPRLEEKTPQLAELPTGLNEQPPQLAEQTPRQAEQPPQTDATELALWLYNPRRDSELLKKEPSDFEWLRGHYPLRREKMD